MNTTQTARYEPHNNAVSSICSGDGQSFIPFTDSNWMETLAYKIKKKNWIAAMIFLMIYLIVLGAAIYTDIYCQWDLNKHDLNMNGIFENNEINPYQQAAFQRLINDTGRNFAVISGLLFAGVISFVVLFITQGFEKYKKLKNEEETREHKKI